MAQKLGDATTKKLATGRLYLQRAGEDSYLDFGNVVDHKYAPDVQRQPHMKSSAGFKRTDLSLVKSIDPRYEFTLDEITPDLERLRQLGGAGSDVVQAGGNVVAEVLVTANSKGGRTYFTVKQGISALVVKVAAAVKMLDVDYSVDLGSGAITIITGGGIADGSTVTADYTAAAVTTVKYDSFKELRVEGKIKYVEFDQFSEVPRQTTTFTGQVHVTNWGENNSEDYNKTQVMCIPLTNPVSNVRKD